MSQPIPFSSCRWSLGRDTPQGGPPSLGAWLSVDLGFPPRLCVQGPLPQPAEDGSPLNFLSFFHPLIVDLPPRSLGKSPGVPFQGGAPGKRTQLSPKLPARSCHSAVPPSNLLGRWAPSQTAHGTPGWGSETATPPPGPSLLYSVSPRIVLLTCLPSSLALFFFPVDFCSSLQGHFYFISVPPM